MGARDTTEHTVFDSVPWVLTPTARSFASVRSRPVDHPTEPSPVQVQFASVYAAKPTDAGIEVPEPVFGPPVILIGTDGEPDRDAALVSWCAALFGRAASLRIVHVLTIPMTTALDVPLPDAENDARRNLAQVARIAKIRGFHVETAVLRHRQTVGGLVEEARRTGATVVVVRARGLATSWAHYFLDRSIRNVWAGVPCAVVTVHLAQSRPIVRIPRAPRARAAATSPTYGRRR